ncbi:SPOR domain-containing protein [Paenibacillus sp. 481]|uniref:SPOR domain-containing protein n=1 Tax=Paenibacillus sp. 481 TaxID=2835869 RepID=UPI001E56F6AE|nr:SPOR domain-containing protein [Paenibacillus sp. 481]UHA74362.1 SPOR domain-containing protein [Paenibacillus sp. 481]
MSESNGKMTFRFHTSTDNEPTGAGEQRKDERAEWDSNDYRSHKVEQIHVGTLHASIIDPAGETLSSQGEPLWEGVRKRTRKYSTWGVIGSIAGAIGMGAVFSFLALALFRGEIEMPEPEDGIPMSGSLSSTANRDVGGGGDLSGGGKVVEKEKDVRSQPDGAKQAATGDGRSSDSVTGNTPNRAAGSVANGVTSSTAGMATSGSTAGGLFLSEVAIPDKSYFLLQYGVFKQLEGASKATEQLHELGLAAVNDTADSQHRVYAGIAQAKDEAMALSEALQAKQVQLFIRQFQRSGVKQLAFRGEARTIEQLIQQSDKVNDWLMLYSLAALEAGAIKPFDQAATEKLRNEHLLWTQTMPKVQEGLPEQAKEIYKRVIQAMNTAIVSVNEYNKKPSAAHLWSIQQSVIVYLLAERDWLESMKA